MLSEVIPYVLPCDTLSYAQGLEQIFRSYSLLCAFSILRAKAIEKQTLF